MILFGFLTYIFLRQIKENLFFSLRLLQIIIIIVSLELLFKTGSDKLAVSDKNFLKFWAKQVALLSFKWRPLKWRPGLFKSKLMLWSKVNGMLFSTLFQSFIHLFGFVVTSISSWDYTQYCDLCGTSLDIFGNINNDFSMVSWSSLDGELLVPQWRIICFWASFFVALM